MHERMRAGDLYIAGDPQTGAASRRSIALMAQYNAAARITIGDDVQIGPNAVADGNPARVVRELDPGAGLSS